MARQYTLHKSTPSHASGIDYVAALNDEQYAAVSSPPGRALVIVSPDATSAVDATLRANMVQGTQPCLLVLLADPGLRRSLCSLTGADLIPADDLRAGFLPEDSLGTCRTWISDEDDSWVILENS